jgi:glutathione S-transferase
MADLEIIGAPQSNYVWSVRLACEEKGVPYRLTPAMPHTPDVDAIHPFGKIPVMRHGDVTLFESKAIVTYIDKAFAGPKLFPDDAATCARIEQWVSSANTTILPGIMGYLACYFFPRTPDGKPDRAAVEKAMPDMVSRAAVLDKAVASGHLAGSGFTYADMNILPALHYMKGCPESADVLGASKHLRAYFDTHAQRASFKATVPPSFAELRR